MRRGLRSICPMPPETRSGDPTGMPDPGRRESGTRTSSRTVKPQAGFQVEVNSGASGIEASYSTIVVSYVIFRSGKFGINVT